MQDDNKNKTEEPGIFLMTRRSLKYVLKLPGMKRK